MKALTYFLVVVGISTWKANLAHTQELDTVDYHLSYSLKENGRLKYFYEADPKGFQPSIRSVNLVEKEVFPRVTLVFSPENWKIDQDILYQTMVASGKKGSFGWASIITVELESRDSLAMVIARNKKREEFESKYGHLDSIARIRKAIEVTNPEARRMNNRAIVPYKALSIENLYTYSERKGDYEEYEEVSLDFLVDNSVERKFRFFFRFKDFFTVWEYIHPDVNVEYGESGSWKELATYSQGQSIPVKKGDWKEYYPSGLKELTQYEAIEDDAFFEGDFKVIRQRRNLFLINTDHGGIYHIGDSKIVKVGQIDWKNYQRKIGGYTVFVEDKDAGELLFFSRVYRTSALAPFPKIKTILEDEEFNEIFKNL